MCSNSRIDTSLVKYGILLLFLALLPIYAIISKIRVPFSTARKNAFLCPYLLLARYFKISGINSKVLQLRGIFKVIASKRYYSQIHFLRWTIILGHLKKETGSLKFEGVTILAH